MATPNWVEDPTAWSIVTLGGDAIPGNAVINGLEAQADIDVKKSKGKDLAKIQDKGRVPSDFTIDITFPPQFLAKIQEICQQLLPNKVGGTRRPVSIDHAQTDFLGVHLVYVKKITAPKLDAKGIGSISIGCLEYVAQPKDTSSTAGSGKAPKAAGERDPNAPGSFITPLNRPVITDVIDPNNPSTPQADKDFLNFMNGTMADQPGDDSFSFSDFNPEPPPAGSEQAKALEASR